MSRNTVTAIKDFDVRRRLGEKRVPKSLILVKRHKFPKDLHTQMILSPCLPVEVMTLKGKEFGGSMGLFSKV